MQTGLVRIAAAFLFLAVALGAFGAHALKDTLAARGFTDVWNKAVLYQFIHAIALLIIAVSGIGPRVTSWLFGGGIFFFSGSLYLLCLTNVRFLGAITPLGGLLFLAGWVCLMVKPYR